MLHGPACFRGGGFMNGLLECAPYGSSRNASAVLVSRPPHEMCETIATVLRLVL